MSPHEFRDCAKTYLHVAAKKQGLDMDCVDFWMGHENRDPNAYDKFMNDETYVFEQYKIAEPHLNIISQPATLALQEQTKRLEELRAEVEHLTKVEKARKPADDLMSTLLEDKEVLDFLKRRLSRLKS